MTDHGLPLVTTGPTPFETEWLAEEDPDGPTRFTTGVPMRDGIELAADVYLPAAAQLPAPVIVQATPYGREGIGGRLDEALYYQRHGYVYVSVDCRGRGASEGEWRPFVHDARDTHDVIEWAGTRSWSTGRVGTTGLSYSGWVQWAAASERPPHLACMVSTSAAGAWMQEIPFTYGAFQGYFLWWLLLVRRRVLEMNALRTMDVGELLGTLPVARAGEIIDSYPQNWELLVRNERLDDFWRALRYDDRYEQMDVPCLHITGWYDLEDLTGAMHHYRGMTQASPAADRQYLIVGPWSHVQSRHPDSHYAEADFGRLATVDMDAVHLRFFDHFLKGADNGVDADPRVRVFATGANEWRTAPRWPLPGDIRVWYLRHDGARRGLDPRPPETDEPAVTYRYDPADPVPTGMDVSRYPLEDPPLDQTGREERPDVVTWTSDPVTEGIELSGSPVLHLAASSTGTDTDWHVRLTDVSPEGVSRKVCQGVLRAAFRDSLDDPRPLRPGEVYEFAIHLWPAHHVFRPGHRIRVSVTSSDFPWYVRNLNVFGPIADQADPVVADNSVHHPKGGISRLEMPVAAG